MKSSVIRSLVIFSAGAGCATVVAGMFPTEPITPGQFQERATTLIAEVEALGAYVGIAQDGRVGIYTDVAACVLPPPPPKLTAPAFNQLSFELGLGALGTMSKGITAGEEQPVYVLGKCRPYPK